MLPQSRPVSQNDLVALVLEGPSGLSSEGLMLPLVCPLCRIALPPVDDVCPRDGHPGRQVSWLPVPAALGHRFQVVEHFAHGDGGSLYIVDEPETGRRGLLKLLSPAHKDVLAERQRLRRELVKQATLTRTHLVVPLASGESEGCTWIFREWLDGVSLDVRLSREGALPQTEALAIAAQIASALDELHRGGLLHRDVKPGHIFLQPTPQGIPRALLLDAGVASRLSTDGASTIYGTAGYVAPEQLLGKFVSFRSDLYSLGCVLYRMLTGRPAFAGESLEQTLSVQRNGGLPPTPADLPNGIGALLQSILAKDPQQRPFSAQKLCRTLDPFLPDGALMEKQSTTTFETVPQPSPSIAPQPSGTLKPPPPPVARPSMPVPPEGLMKPRHSSAPPPPPPSRQPIPEERTQQIDIAQLQEIAQPKRSVPPPTPSASKSSLPPAPAKPPTELTQPIRLEQILAVEAARRSSNQPPKLLDEESTGVFHPRHVAGAPKSAESEPPEPLHRPALFAAQDEPFAAPPASTVLPGLGAPALFQPAAEPLRPAPLARPKAPEPVVRAASLPPATPTVRPKPVVLSQPPPIAAAAPVVSEVAFAPTLSGAQVSPFEPALPRPVEAHASAAEGFAKATLMGIGADPLASSGGFDAGAFQPSYESAMADVRGEREYETERVSLLSPAVPRLDDSSLQDAFGSHASAAGSIPSSPVSTGQQRDSRRLLMYASAAVVGLAVLSVGASALRSKPAAVASAQVPALPVVAAGASKVEAERAQAPKPTVHSLAPSTAPIVAPAAPASAQLAAAEPAATPTPAAVKSAPVVEPIAPAEPIKPEPKLAPETAMDRDEVASKSSAEPEPRMKHGSHHEARERARNAKSSSADKPGDKLAQSASARADAQAAFAAKNYKAAAAAYERAARADPTNPGTFAGLGAALMKLGDSKGALHAYQKAVKLSPQASGLHAALGRSYLANGDKAKAISEYKRALALDPKNEAAKYALAQL
ncbi:MAG: Serine/threonine protein kinase [Myxococcaceae bacterium]|nr:Serine/threonine protein kinase [Myxococcaceae bacterium]